MSRVALNAKAILLLATLVRDHCSICNCETAEKGELRKRVNGIEG